MEKEFENWLCEKYSIPQIIWEDGQLYLDKLFQDLPFEFQWGVYLKYYDEKGIIIDIANYQTNNAFEFWINDIYPEKTYDTREEAQKAALEKAKELTKE